MKTIVPDNLDLLWKSFEYRKKCRLAVVMLGGFVLEDSPDPVIKSDLWETIQDEMNQTQPLDAGMPKPNGEVLAAGYGYQPDGKPNKGLEVRLRIGSIDKRLYLIGDRHWKRVAGMMRAPSSPEPFTEMPITWENAYGGDDFNKNPLGKGNKPVLAETGEKIHPMPNIEDPGALVASVSDRPEPAGFGPLEIHWPQRIGKAGTYNQRWIEETWPDFPDDMDWNWFNAAPFDQQMDGYFKGNEPITITHMHPDRPLIESRLPGLRARCFVKRKMDDGEEVFKEVRTYLDTVWLFPGSGIGLALHRGVTEVTDDEAEDVSHVLAEWEPLTEERKPIEFYEELLRQKTARVPEDEQPEEPPIEPVEPEASTAEPVIKIPKIEAPAPEVPDEMQLEMERRLAGGERKIRAHLRVSGLDPDKVLKPKPDPETAGLDDEAVERIMNERMVKAQARIDQVLREQGTSLEEAKIKARQAGSKVLLKNIANILPPGMMGRLPEIEAMIEQMEAETTAIKPEPPPPPPIKDQIQAGLPEGKSFAGQDLSGEDLSHMNLIGLDLKGAVLRKTNFTGSNLERADLSGADLTEAVLSKATLTSANLSQTSASAASFLEADLTGAHLSKAALAEAVFSKAILASADLSEASASATSFLEADLTGADLSGADLKDAQMTGAMLRSAVMKGTRAEGASMAGAIMTEADLSQADLTGADLSKADLVRIRMIGTTAESANVSKVNLSEADLSESDFTGADLTGARLSQADLTGAYLEGAVLAHTDMSGIKAAGTVFTGADCSHAVFHEADLKQADFSQAKLNRADFSNAKAASASFGDAEGERVKFNGADLKGVRAGGQTSLIGADFTTADLTGASWGEANLSESDFSGTEMEKADFTKCNLHKARFKGVRARGASFLKADLTGADLTRADLFQTTLRKAKLVNADFKGASLYMADFFRATLGDTDFREADLKRTLLSDWRPS